jgi:hypothetical protein
MTTFAEAFETFEREAFRLETLPAYDVPGQEDLAEWHATLDAGRARGAVFRRVHVVERPLSEYLRWEVEQYKLNAQHGEKIRLVEAKSADDVPTDFWLFDRGHAFDMQYDEDGRFLGAVEVTQEAEVDRRIEAMDQLWEKSVELDAWEPSLER